MLAATCWMTVNQYEDGWASWWVTQAAVSSCGLLLPSLGMVTTGATTGATLQEHCWELSGGLEAGGMNLDTGPLSKCSEKSSYPVLNTK